MFQRLIFPIIGVVQVINAANILAYFPIPAKSHHYFFTPTLYALGERGHHVDYYSPHEPKWIHPNVTFVEIENLMPLFYEKTTDDRWYEKYLPNNEYFLTRILRIGVRMAEKLSTLPPVKNLLKSNVKYDLLLHEGFIMMEHGHVFAHKFNVSASVSLLSVSDLFAVNEFAGLANNPAFMVNGLSTSVTDRMDFFDRLYNTVSNGIFHPLAYYHYLSQIQEVIDESFTFPGWESRPPLKELMADTALFLANGHHSVGFPLPKAPNYKEIGGAVMQPTKPLPQDLERFINESTEGVIYFSLGTIVDLDRLDSNLKHIFARVFAGRKERILWKWSGVALQNVSNNVKVSHFFPQQNILGHKNVKLFITHSGLQSSFEAVHFAVPLVIVPCYADQIKNSLALQQAGYGVVVRLSNITEESLNWAIDEVTRNPKYKQMITKGSEALRDRPGMSPVDEAVYWIEYVLRHGRVLQSAGAKLSLVQLHCWDVYLFLVATVVVACSLTLWLIRRCASVFTRGGPVQKVKRN